jgi:hypothetical protein
MRPERYYEPYYVIFAHLVDDELDEQHAAPSRRPLEIAHHTIPRWLPLQELSTKYLRVRVRGEDDAFRKDGDDDALRKTAIEPDLDASLPLHQVFLVCD